MSIDSTTITKQSGLCSRPSLAGNAPQTSIMLQNIVPSQVGQREAGVVPTGICQHRSPEKRDRNGIVLVYTLSHCQDKVISCDVFAAAREKAMIGESVESGAWASD